MKLREVFDLADLHVYCGLVLMGAGVAAIYWPAALITVGVGLFYLGARV